LFYAPSLPLFFLARIPVGLVKQTMVLSLGYISSVTKKEERTRYVGYLNAIYDLGLVLGPAISGLLLSTNFIGLPIFISIILFLADLLFVVIFVPDLRSYDDKNESQVGPKESFLMMFKRMVNEKGEIYYIFIVRFVSRFAVILSRSHFSFLLSEIGLGPSYNAYFMSYTSALYTVSISIIPFFTSRFSEKNLMIFSNLIMGITFILMISTTNAWQLAIVLVPNIFGSSFDRVIISSAITKLSPSSQLGEVLGFSESLGNIIKIFSPFISGFIIGYINMTALYCISSILSLSVAYLTYKRKLFD